MSGVDWVHHDLTRGCAVVRRAESRKVRERFDWVEISGATPQVSVASVARIVRKFEQTGKPARDVHATIRGQVVASGLGAPDLEGLRRISYNPFKGAFFRFADTGEEWKGSARVIVTGGSAYEVQR